ncbi:MAG: CPBP family intramembrane metalloprotease [Phycisphaerae bacterium]|nr:CPBP family intramembrane metalloprotease [Phycisphaerae bacterium]
MNTKVILTILKKELLETLRDKRTLIAMIGIPIVLYPLLFLGVAQVAVHEQVKLQKQNSRVALVGDSSEIIKGWLAETEKVEIVETESAEQDLKNGDVDVIVKIESDIDETLLDNKTVAIKLDYDNTVPRSQKATNRLGKAIREKSAELLNQRLEKQGLDKEFSQPLRTEVNDIAPPAKTTGSMLGRILPMLMIIMLGVGAFYPAVDLTAGEKERGTFETLLSTPAAKSEIVCGKFLAVFVLAMITAMLNLASMGLTISSQVSMMAGAEGQGVGGLDISSLQISFGNIMVFFIVLLPLAFFICSVMMGIAMLARNFKEAQNYINPFYMMIVLPAMYASMPGVELNATTQLIPITNVALLFKKMLIGEFVAQEVIMVLLSTVFFAALALVGAVAIFQREDVILSQEKGMPFTLNRKAFVPSLRPTMGLSFAMFPIAMLLSFYVGQYLQTCDFVSGVILTQYGLYAGLPIAILIYIKVNVKETLSLKMPKVSDVIVVPFIALASIVLVNLYAGLQGKFIEVPEAFEEMMQVIFDKHNLGVLIFVVAVTPAICEEILARGIIMAGLKGRMPDWATILLVGMMFGAMHMVISNIIPTALLGMVIAYLVLRTGSIFVGMLFHFINNGFSVLAEKKALPEGLMIFLENIEKSQGGMVLLVGVAVIVFVVCVVVIEAGHRKKLTVKS